MQDFKKIREGIAGRWWDTQAKIMVTWEIIKYAFAWIRWKKG